MKNKICLSGLIFLGALLLTSCSNLIDEAEIADQVFVEADRAELDIGFAAGDSPSAITENLKLPTAIQETTIVWVSDNPDVLTNEGVINRPEFDEGSITVNLVAMITAGTETREKVFTVTILPLEPTNAQAIGADTDALEITLGGTDVASFVTQDIVLTSTGLWGTTITWASDKPGSISTTGDVTCSTSDETVIMTATISRGDGISETKDFTFTVKATGTAPLPATVNITVTLPAAPAATALVFQDAGTTVTGFTVIRGTPVTITTTFADASYAWYVDGSAIAVSTTSSCTLNGNSYTAGNHTLLLDVLSGGKYYSGRIDFTVRIVVASVSLSQIEGIAVPIPGETPAATVTPTDQYTGTIVWSPAVAETFGGVQSYTATITLVPKAGYTLSGVTANFFTVEDATTVTNAAGFGVVTAVFPTTDALVTFVADYGYASSQVIALNSYATLPDPGPPIPPNYNFMGWFSDQALSNPYTFEEPVIGNMTIYGYIEFSSQK